MPAPKKIAFYPTHPFHRTILEPVARAMTERSSVLISDQLKELKDYAPDLLVVADPYYPHFRKHFPKALLVFTRHGFASKNLVRHAFSGFDFACVSSPWVQADFESRGIRPRLGFWATGFPPTDILFQRHRDDSKSEHQPLLLYAPSHDENFHSMHTLGVDWIATVRKAFPGLRILIKPHPVTRHRHPHWLREWQQAAETLPGVGLVEGDEENIYPLMLKASILMTDISSVGFYFTALDRPILFINPRSTISEAYNFDPQGPEWLWRDMGLQVESVEQLVDAIDRSLKNPAELADIRGRYRARIFGSMVDGRSAARVACRIEDFYKIGPEQPSWARQAWIEHKNSPHYELSGAALWSFRRRWLREFWLRGQRGLRNLVRKSMRQ